MQKKFLKGAVIFGALLVITSILEMQKFLSFDNYRRVFQQIPEGLIVVRYAISVGLRILGFIAGVGILFRRNIARKLAIFIAIFTICTIYWKHPYFAVANACRVIFYTMYNQSGATQFVLPPEVKLITILALAVFYLIDIVFAVSLIYYFTRPKVKEQFS